MVQGRQIGSGRVNREDDGNGQSECQRSAGCLSICLSRPWGFRTCTEHSKHGSVQLNSSHSPAQGSWLSPKFAQSLSQHRNFTLEPQEPGSKLNSGVVFLSPQKVPTRGDTVQWKGNFLGRDRFCCIKKRFSLVKCWQCASPRLHLCQKLSAHVTQEQLPNVCLGTSDNELRTLFTMFV